MKVCISIHVIFIYLIWVYRISMKSRIRRLQDLRERILELRNKYVKEKDQLEHLINTYIAMSVEDRRVENQWYNDMHKFIKELEEVLKDE